MKKALKIIESLRASGFMVHYSKFSQEHLERIVNCKENNGQWKLGCYFTCEVFPSKDEDKSKYNNKDWSGRRVFYATDKTMLRVLNNITKQIKEARIDNGNA